MNTTYKEQVINEVHWENGLTYPEYRELISKLLKISQTTGDNHSEQMIEYTSLNEQRMKKWDKITKITPEVEEALRAIDTKQKWLLLTEAWCGDAAQNIPAINKIAELNPLIELRLLLRDENLDIMDAYLTDGGRSIPILIIMNEALIPITTWGPRPSPVQEILKVMKSGTITYEEFALNAHAWYAKDKTLTLQDEILSIIQQDLI